MPSEELKKLAEELKESREKADVTLQFIATKTRIDLKFLQAMEEGNFEVLPEVYIRAFIREYAAYCDLDPQKTLEKYELAKAGKSIDKAEKESVEEPEKTEIEETKTKKQFTDESAKPTTLKSKKGNNQKLILYGGAIVLLAIIIAAYFIFIKNSSPDIVVEKPFEEVLQEQNKRFELTEEEAPKQPIAKVDSLVLSIKATDTCWVNVKIDESVDKEFMLYNNTSTVVKAAERFDVVVGNAGDITMELNGNALEITGTKGQRKTFSVDKDGIINSSN